MKIKQNSEHLSDVNAKLGRGDVLSTIQFFIYKIEIISPDEIKNLSQNKMLGTKQNVWLMKLNIIF